MNKKFFLVLILISTLLFSTFFPIIEGACSYEDGGSIASDNSLAQNGESPVVSRTKNSCQTAGIYKNEEKLKEVTEKLNELTNISDDTENSVITNTQGVSKNTQNRKRIQSLTDDSVDAEGDEMCKDFPDSCKTTELPDPISTNEYNRQMARR
tara:strand:- start:3730 stop:4188 length:459 start_codon:yes stop_codon:yes gene_type:complete